MLTTLKVSRRVSSFIPLLLALILFMATVGVQASETVRLVFGTPLASWGEMVEARDAYQRANPHIEIELVSIDGDLAEGLLRFAVSGQLPDMFSMHHDILPGLIGHQFLTELTPFFERDPQVSTGDYAALDMGVAGIWGLPLTTNSEYTVYNLTLFEEMGLAPPHDVLDTYASNWTPDEFSRVALQLTRDTNGDGEIDMWGYSGYGNLRDPNGAEAMLWPFGAALFDRDGTPTVGSDEMIEALSFWNELVVRGMDIVGNINQDNPNWVQGRIAMGITNRVHFAATAQAVSFDWALAPVPYKPGVPRSTVGTGHYFSIGHTSEHKEEAWQFLTWLTGPEGHQILAPRALFPGNRRAFPVFQEFWDTAPSDWNAPQNLELVWLTTAYSRPPSITGSSFTRQEVQPLLTDVINRAVIGSQMPVREAATDFQRRLEGIMASR